MTISRKIFGLLLFGAAFGQPLTAQTRAATPSYPFAEFRDQLLVGTSPTEKQLADIEAIAERTWQQMSAMNATMKAKTPDERKVVAKQLMVEQGHAINKVMTPAQSKILIKNYDVWAKRADAPSFSTPVSAKPAK